MLNVDESRWPVVEITGSEQRSDEEIVVFTEAIDRYLARQEPFVLVMVTIKDDQPHNPLAANQLMKWLKKAKPAITANCLGIVSVLESVEERARYGPMIINQGQQIYGCPAFLVATVEEANEWAADKLAAVSKA